MRALLLERVASLRDEPRPLSLVERDVPRPEAGEARLHLHACGVCHTELDEIEGRTAPAQLPRVLGHQAIGVVDEVGADVSREWIGKRVGVAWIFRACGRCHLCRSGRENLCRQFEATGRDVDGGYADYMTAPVEFVHEIPPRFSSVEAAPLLCAGAVGYRALRLARVTDGDSIGFTGFGASAHLVLQAARHLYPRSPVHVFARKEEERAFARSLGAVWAGDTRDRPPVPLAAIIDTTPAWTPVIEALASLEHGGRLVINAIRKEDRDREALGRIDYASHLWLEREIKTVANVTRADVREFLTLAAAIPIKPEVQTFPLEAANEALVELATRHVRGAKVLEISNRPAPV